MYIVNYNNTYGSFALTRICLSSK